MLLFRFRQFNEAKSSGKAAVIAFGRFQPPTIGHEKLVATMIKLAGRNKEVRLYPSKSFDPKKNPLTFADKVKYLKIAFPGVFVDTDKTVKNPFEAIGKMIDTGYTDIMMVVGSDRLSDFKKYTKNIFKDNIDMITIISAGDRDPDSDDGLVSISASKMRQNAIIGDLESFKSGLPKRLRKSAREVFNDIRFGMKLSEENDVIDEIKPYTRILSFIDKLTFL